jgi:hypothetical protein
MTSYWPMSIVEHGLGLNITVLSYAGSMDFGFTTAPNVVGDARELSAALMESLEELVTRGGLQSPKHKTRMPTQVPSAATP